jgi:hypothetical protein
MPNWSDDEGRSYFGKIECKRCLQDFEYDKKTGEVPVHKCVDGKLWTSAYMNGTHHYPVRVKESK